MEKKEVIKADKGLADRLNQIVEYCKLSQRKFALMFDFNPNTWLNYVNARQNPPATCLMAILSSFKEISAEWLLRGEGDMIKIENKSLSELRKENAELKVKLLVAEGVTREIKEIIKGRIQDEPKKESLVG